MLQVYAQNQYQTIKKPHTVFIYTYTHISDQTMEVWSLINAEQINIFGEILGRLQVCNWMALLTT